jgi:hypothetical protein
VAPASHAVIQACSTREAARKTMPMSRQAAASLALMPGVVITFCPGWAGCVSAHAFAASLPWRCSVVIVSPRIRVAGLGFTGAACVGE